MPKLTRKTQKIFCGSADNDQLAVFGSMATGTPVYTNDVEQLQGNAAYNQGWEAATLEDKAPFVEEMNGVQYSTSYQLAYLLQQGIAEWDSNTTYYTHSFVSFNDGNIYQSLQDNNIGNNPSSSATYWKQLNLNAANIDLSNLSATGETHFLNKTQITNCILSVEELVKVEPLTNGRLELKAGSVVYVSTNGTFNEVTISSNVSAGSTGLFTTAGTRELFCCYVPSKNELINIPVNETFSQATAPTTFLANLYGGWYDTTNKIMKYTNDAGATWTVCSLPFVMGTPSLISDGGTGWIGNIKHIFNGYGYVGQYTFTTRGLKYLIPNGRNTDETLKNIEVNTNKLTILSSVGNSSKIAFLRADGSLATYGVTNYFEQEEAPTGFTGSAKWLNTYENKMYATSDSGATWRLATDAYFGIIKKNGNDNITQIKANKPVELVKRVEFEKINSNVINLNNTKLSLDNSTMVVSSSGVLCKIGDRNFYKRNSGWALCALIFGTTNFGGPVLIGKSLEAVAQYNDYDTNDTTTTGSLLYKGEKYYYSFHNASMPIESAWFKQYPYPILTNEPFGNATITKVLDMYYSSTTYSMPTSSYLDDTIWYDIWGNGKIEAGGILVQSALGTEISVTFPTPISKVLNIKFTNYAPNANSQFHDGINVKSISTTGFTAFVGSVGEGSNPTTQIMWEVKGYK